MRELFGWYTERDWFGYLFVRLASLFKQFVLLPLVVLYMAILYAYLGRILLYRALPQGWVSVLILALAVAGIFALLLIHPLRHNPENTWIRTFARWFYRALFPLLGLLAVAIGVRIADYGITEERYFVLLLAAWLLGTASHFLWRRGQGIIWIPVSLAVLAFLSAAGPWGAFATAERSQLGQLRELTDLYHLLQNGKLDGAAARVPTLPRPARGRLASLFNFFSERDALASLQLQFTGSLVLPDSLGEKEQWEQQQWRNVRHFHLSGFEYLDAYQVQMAVDDTQQEQSTSYYLGSTPHYYALGQGRYWLKDVGSLMDGADSTGQAVLALPVREGRFRLLMLPLGDSVLLQQQAATGTWQTQLRLALHPLADSLTEKYGNRLTQIDLPAPLELRAQAGRLQLHLFLFLSSMSYEQFGKETRYIYTAEGLLEIAPEQRHSSP